MTTGSMRGIVRWADPPRNEQDDIDDLVRELREKPNAWALVLEGVQQYEIDRVVGLMRRSDLGRCIEVKSMPLSYDRRPKDLYARFVPRP